MQDHPVYVRMPAEDNKTYFQVPSAAEVVAGALMNIQHMGWLRLHGFVVLPDSLQMVATPLKQGVAGIVAQLQSETIPLLVVLLPQAGLVWATRYTFTPLRTQRALDAQLNMLQLAPVAAGIADSAEQYSYSSVNSRYIARVSVYAGFDQSAPKPPPRDNAKTTVADTEEKLLPKLERLADGELDGDTEKIADQSDTAIKLPRPPKAPVDAPRETQASEAAATNHHEKPAEKSPATTAEPKAEAEEDSDTRPTPTNAAKPANKPAADERDTTQTLPQSSRSQMGSGKAQSD